MDIWSTGLVFWMLKRSRTEREDSDGCTSCYGYSVLCLFGCSSSQIESRKGEGLLDSSSTYATLADLALKRSRVSDRTDNNRIYFTLGRCLGTLLYFGL